MKIDGYIISDSGNIAAIVDGQSHTIATDHCNYTSILEALKSNHVERLVKLMDLQATIKEISKGKVAIVNGCIVYNGKEVVNPLTERILRFAREELPFDPMLVFLENLMSNPSRTAIQELYLFMDNNELPITEDGYLLAYRKVDNEYMSFHKNPDDTYNRNMVGDVIEMERNEVDDIRGNTCSEGLHFCSIDYLPQYYGGSGRVVVVKINPADVVSIPSDYDNAKGRTCRYEVIAEHTDPKKEYKEYSTSAVVSPDGDEGFFMHIGEQGEYGPVCGADLEDGGEWDDRFANVQETPLPEPSLPKRDSKGRFIKKQ